MDTLEGKTAVVTGAGSGMGRAFANRFAAAGMSVVLADVEEPALADALAEVRASGAEAIGVRTDVSKLEQVEALLAASLDAFGRVNVVCNNAGVGGDPAPPWEQTLEDWQWVLGVNLWGVIHGCKVFIPHLLTHGDGHVVNTASIAGLTVSPSIAPYHVSKHGVVALSESVYAALAVASPGVGVSLLCPGFVATRIIDSARNRPEELIPRGEPRQLTPDEEAQWTITTEMLKAGKPPSEVADLVHDAILAKQFYIYTDDVWAPVIRGRHAAIQAGTNPSLNPLDDLLGQGE